MALYNLKTGNHENYSMLVCLPSGSDAAFKREYSEHAVDGEELKAISGGVGAIATAAEHSGADPEHEAPVGLDGGDEFLTVES